MDYTDTLWFIRAIKTKRKTCTYAPVNRSRVRLGCCMSHSLWEKIVFFLLQ